MIFKYFKSYQHQSEASLSLHNGYYATFLFSVPILSTVKWIGVWGYRVGDSFFIRGGGIGSVGMGIGLSPQTKA